MITMKGGPAITVMHGKGFFRADGDGVIVIPPELEARLTALGFSRVGTGDDAPLPDGDVAEDPTDDPDAPVIITDAPPPAPPAEDDPPAVGGDADARQRAINDLVAGGLSVEEATELVDGEMGGSTV